MRPTNLPAILSTAVGGRGFAIHALLIDAFDLLELRAGDVPRRRRMLNRILEPAPDAPLLRPTEVSAG